MAATGERVLITGGGGFLGACLARSLLADGQEVHLLLRGRTNPWRLAGLKDRYKAHAGDICDASAVRRAVEASRPEIVYHLAAHGAYPSQRDRDVILATNILGTANLINALEGRDYQRLVNVGSSSEYGHKSDPMRPDDRLEPRTDYAVSKAAATHLCMAEAFKGRPVVTVRVFSAYGPWEEPTRLVPYVMRCCSHGKSPEVTAGRQPRDFVYVDDVVDLIRVAAVHPQARGQILHAGTGRRQTVRDMIETIMAICGAASVEYGKEHTRPDEPPTWVADIEDTSTRVGWRPRHDLQAGVARMWQWFSSHEAAHAA
jgi:nucleoside-diphosphate-sugar epimerase